MGGGRTDNPNCKKPHIHIFIQSSARAKWCRLPDVTPRNALIELPVHDIPDGGERVDPFDPESERIWQRRTG
jgi:hypothetical protein